MKSTQKEAEADSAFRIMRLRWLALVSLLALAIPLAVTGLGYRMNYVVLSESMIPVLHPGDFVITNPMVSDVEVGDIVTFQSPLGGFLIHRIMEVVERDGEIFFVTKGDANAHVDSFLIPEHYIIGKLFIVLPHVGSLFLIPRVILLVLNMGLVMAYVVLAFRLPSDDKDPVKKNQLRRTPKPIQAALIMCMLSIPFVAQSSIVLIYPSDTENITTTSPLIVLQEGTQGTSTITDNINANVSVAAPLDWWNTDYGYRKQISIINNVAATLDSNYSVCSTVNTTSLVSSDKLLANGNDLRIVHWNGSTWTELDRDIIDMNTSSTQIWFKTQADVSASGSDNNYYMYYGNPPAVNPPSNKSNVYDFWDDFDDGSLDAAWTFSQIGTATGSYSESGTVVILNATNSGDLWDNSDNILFLSISRSYAVLVESYTSSWGGSHGIWSKMGGVQLRQSFDSNSKNRIMSPVYSATGATNSYRLSTGGSTSEQITATQPRYNRLSRIGETSRAWYSTDGASWIELGSQISFSGGLYDPAPIGIHLAGLSSSSHWVEVDWFKVRKYVDPEPSTSLGSEENWLSGWDKRIKITIDRNDIDGSLSDFPVLVYLSNSSGRNGNDVSFIFDELQSDANRKKIAVTKSDGTTECYVEIEKWDDANEQAWLWVKVPDVAADADTDLYLYYDNTHADNTDYVGDPNSTPSENAWNSNYVVVLHFSEEGVGTRYDSTSYSNDGSVENYDGDEATNDGIIDGADHFDGTNDTISVNDSPSIGFTSNQLTLESWAKFDTLPSTETVIMRKDNQWQIGFIDSNTIRNLVQTNGVTGWTVANDEDYSFSTNTWYYWTFVYDGSTIAHKINAQQAGSSHTVTGNIVDNSNVVYIAYNVYSGGYLDGVIDEVRISNVTRSNAWIRASYESGRDNLLYFGSEESANVTYDYVLRVNNTAEDSWQIRLKKYSELNINRLQNCTISFHNATDGTSKQVSIENGVYTQDIGSWYDLPSSTTIYIAMTVDSNSTGISQIFTYLEINAPNSGIFNLYKITYKIT